MAPTSFPTALDVIFTCDICQASVSDIYGKGGPGATETDFHDGRADTTDRRVTSLWLTQCMHLTCGKHLEGGGAPFHPKGQHPKAPCPLCRQEKGDEKPKVLYAVRGLRPGTFDPDIPDVLFQVPPMKLQGETVEKEALQFQYLSLIRYGTTAAHRQNELEQAKRKVELRAKKIGAENAALARENKELTSKLSSLEKDAVDIDKWRKRLPKVTHYLKQWPLVIDEVNRLREQLVNLGYAVPKNDYSFREMEDENPKTVAQECQTEYARVEREPAAARSPPRDTRTECRTMQTHNPGSSSSRKRKLSECAHRASRCSAVANDQPLLNNEYRDRGADVREVNRRKDASDRREKAQNLPASNALPPSSAKIKEVQTFHNGKWHEYSNAGTGQRTLNIPKRHERRETDDAYFMTEGIAQCPRLPQEASKSRIPPAFDKFRDYLRDSEGRNTYRDESAFHVHDKQPKPPRLPMSTTLHDQSTIGTGITTNGIRQSGSWPSVRQAKVSSDHFKGLDLSSSSRNPDRRQRFGQDPTTPLIGSHKFSRQPHIGQSSSPFFSRVRGTACSGLSLGVAGLSAHARVGTVTRNHKPPTIAEQKWNQPRTLNGLSFIKTPHDRNQNKVRLQDRSSSAWEPERSGVNRHLDPPDPHRTHDGFFVRPAEQPRLSSSYFSSGPGLQPSPAASGPFQTPKRTQSIHRFAPPVSDRGAVIFRDDARNVDAGSRARATASFYQKQERAMGLVGPAGHQRTEVPGLFSSAGRRAVRR